MMHIANYHLWVFLFIACSFNLHEAPIVMYLGNDCLWVFLSIECSSTCISRHSMMKSMCNSLALVHSYVIIAIIHQQLGVQGNDLPMHAYPVQQL